MSGGDRTPINYEALAQAAGKADNATVNSAPVVITSPASPGPRR